MAHVHHDTVSSWEWDSVLLLSNAISSPAVEAGGRSRGGGGRRNSDYEGHGHHQHESTETTVSLKHAESWSSETQDQDSSRGKGRDPRLDCPNFLAGKVPCACTENDDDDDSGVSRKRSKPVPRCQVAACRADLTELKGYHQRHRVCLRCAHATRVLLRELPHRYCQQCGKFHPICDFDEGKRSCRRKLEKHNNRRRRKAGEDSLTTSDFGDMDTPDDSPPGDGTKADMQSEEEQRESAQEKLSAEAEVNELPALSSSEQLSMSANLSPMTSDVPDETRADVPVQILRHSAADLSGILPTPESAPIGRLESEHGQPRPLTEEAPAFTLAHGHESSDTICRELSMNGNPHPETGEPHIRVGHDDESLLALLMDENGETEDHRFQENGGEHFTSTPGQLWESSTSLRGNSKEMTYASSLPTGRISFKLYDWNPGDFPRHLRQQVMEWLSSMPVDLEGYIRSGCTILTIFLAMPQSQWDKLAADWSGAVLKLVNAERSVPRFWSSGYLTARMDDHVVHFNHGKLVYPGVEKVQRLPLLDLVRPLCLEVGCGGEVTIRGRNILQAHSRLLVSFNGKYLVKEEYQAITQEESRGAVTRVEISGTDEEAAMLFVSMPEPPKLCGMAYVEVEHELGISNFLPLLVAEKKVVEEIGTLEEELDRPTSSHIADTDDGLSFSSLNRKRVRDILFDIGWVLNISSSEHFKSDDFQSEILKLQAERLRRLLFFAVKRNWFSVVEVVLRLAHRMELLHRIGVLESGLTALQVATLHLKGDMVWHLISCAESLVTSAKCCKFWWDLGFCGPRGLTALHLVALQPGLHAVCSNLHKKEGIAAVWNFALDDRGRSPHDYSTGTFQSKRKIHSSAFHLKCTAKAVSSISNETIEITCEDECSSSEPGEARKDSRKSLPSQVASPRKTCVRVTRNRRHKKLVLDFGNFGQGDLGTVYGSKGDIQRTGRLFLSVGILLICARWCLNRQHFPDNLKLPPTSSGRVCGFSEVMGHNDLACFNQEDNKTLNIASLLLSS